jgi:hypothetical protein
VLKKIVQEMQLMALLHPHNTRESVAKPLHCSREIEYNDYVLDVIFTYECTDLPCDLWFLSIAPMPVPTGLLNELIEAFLGEGAMEVPVVMPHARQFVKKVQ